MRVLAEIPGGDPGLPAGTLRRAELDALAALLGKLGEAGSVLVTGEAPGRRRAAVGIATAATAAGRRAALLECDLVEPGLADALGLAAAPGLHEYLRGTAGSEEILKPVVLAGPGSAAAGEPLVCVVAGRPASDGTALLGSERFRHAVAGLRGAYELVVVDGPPPAREAELQAAMASADVTLAWAESAKAAPSLPGGVAGLLVAARGRYRS